MEKINTIILICVLAITVLTIGYVFLIYHKIKRLKVVNKNVEDNASFIRSGAITFLKREFKIIIPFVFIIALVFVALGFIPAFKGAEGIGWKSAICFIQNKEEESASLDGIFTIAEKLIFSLSSEMISSSIL